jgi:CRP/FNR family cyclic AMP-dependent transcriptional regulator
LTLQFLQPGDWFGDLPISATSSQIHCVWAKSAARVGKVHHEAMSALMTKHAEFLGMLLEWQSTRMALLMRLLEEQATSDLPTRMACQLLRLARQYGATNGPDEIRITLPLVQAEFADLTGCSRQRANEQIVQLIRRGLVRFEAGSYVVTDRRELVRLCGAEL